MVDPLDEEYARPAFRRDRMVMMHWYYFPDSYDSWVATELPVDPPDSPAPHTPPWRVCSLLFNFYVAIGIFIITFLNILYFLSLSASIVLLCRVCLGKSPEKIPS